MKRLRRYRWEILGILLFLCLDFALVFGPLGLFESYGSSEQKQRLNQILSHLVED